METAYGKPADSRCTMGAYSGHRFLIAQSPPSTELREPGSCINPLSLLVQSCVAFGEKPYRPMEEWTGPWEEWRWSYRHCTDL